MQKKKDYEDLLIKILNPIKTRFSNGCAYINFGVTSAHYTERAKGIESFSRPLWGLVPYYACKNEEKDHSFSEFYKKGFANGTNSQSDEYWQIIRDYDQTIVEMAAMGFALMLAPDEFFYKLSGSEQTNLANWLYEINNYKSGNNNWRLFAVLVNCGLQNVGMKYNNDAIEDAINEMDKWYLGDGWYSDGAVDRCDYYTAFAIHFYSLVYAKYIEKTNPERSAKLKNRATEFAKSYIKFFAQSGEAVPFARSMTYRFAQVSFWSALLWADCSPFSVGIVKGIINRHLEYWMNSPIFDDSGVLTIGYRFPNLLMSDDYNAPGSPYWALKSFLFLALPENHEFYNAEPQPLPKMEEIIYLKAPQYIISNNGTDVVLYPHGLNFDYNCCLMAEKYSKFAYSSKFGFNVPRSEYQIEMKAPDSMLAFLVDGKILVRNIISSYEIIDENQIKTVWSPCKDIEVETIITPGHSSHKRKHIINSKIDCTAFDMAFAVPFDLEKSQFSAEDNEAYLITDLLGCKITAKTGTPKIVNTSPNTNVLYTKTKIPAIMFDIKTGKTEFASEISTTYNGIF